MKKFFCFVFVFGLVVGVVGVVGVVTYVAVIDDGDYDNVMMLLVLVWCSGLSPKYLDKCLGVSIGNIGSMQIYQQPNNQTGI